MKVLTVKDLIRELNKYEDHVMILVATKGDDGVWTRTIEELEFDDTDFGQVVILK